MDAVLALALGILLFGFLARWLGEGLGCRGGGAQGDARDLEAQLGRQEKHPRPPSPVRPAASVTYGSTLATQTISPPQSRSQRSRSMPSQGRLRVYHGTSFQASWQIHASGVIHASKWGLYGSKVYFSKNLQKAQEFGPSILECEVDEIAVTQIEERRGIVYCDDFKSANGTILRVFQARESCSSTNQCCEAECRQCRTANERRQLLAARREANKEEREQSKVDQWKWCPGVGGAPCKGDGWRHVQANVCKTCRKGKQGSRKGRR